MMSKTKNILEKLLKEVSPVDQVITSDRMMLAARIADLIKERGIDKFKFAEITGVRPYDVGKWLSGTYNFRLDTLSEIAFALNVPIGELFSDFE